MYQSVEMTAVRKKLGGKEKALNSDQRRASSAGATPDVAMLLYWLNGGSTPTDRYDYMARGMNSASVARVVALITAMQDAGKRLKEEFDKDSDRNFWSDTPKSVTKALRVVDEILQEYHHQPFVEILGIDPAEGVGPDGLQSLQINYVLSSQRPLGEQVAVGQIIHLVSAKKFYLLRQCIVCHKWFLASRSDQVTCSPGCRDKVYRQTEEYKTKQRELMRKIYHQKKQAKTKDNKTAKNFRELYDKMSPERRADVEKRFAKTIAEMPQSKHRQA
jgi:uncharacterized protein (DUF2267 family)